MDRVEHIVTKGENAHLWSQCFQRSFGSTTFTKANLSMFMLISNENTFDSHRFYSPNGYLYDCEHVRPVIPYLTFSNIHLWKNLHNTTAKLVCIGLRHGRHSKSPWFKNGIVLKIPMAKMSGYSKSPRWVLKIPMAIMTGYSGELVQLENRMCQDVSLVVCWKLMHVGKGICLYKRNETMSNFNQLNS